MPPYDTLMSRMARMTQQSWLIAGATMAVVLAGCTATQTVMLQHPQTHETVQCAEGYRRFIDGQGYQRQEDCVAGYQRQGY